MASRGHEGMAIVLVPPPSGNTVVRVASPLVWSKVVFSRVFLTPCEMSRSSSSEHRSSVTDDRILSATANPGMPASSVMANSHAPPLWWAVKVASPSPRPLGQLTVYFRDSS